MMTQLSVQQRVNACNDGSGTWSAQRNACESAKDRDLEIDALSNGDTSRNWGR